MKYYLVAGEASGDLHGSLLIAEIIRHDPQASFRFVGGNKMIGMAGSSPFMHYNDMSFMGFLEVFKNLGTILSNLKKCKADILSFQPDVLILIDFPGFNLRLADFAHKAGLQVFFFISPKVWAWNQKRVLKIRRDIDRMFVIFPFEVDFYKKWGMDVDYIGNPLMDAIEQFRANPGKPSFLSGSTAGAGSVSGGGSDAGSGKGAVSATGVTTSLAATATAADSRPIIALVPGSRRQEISMILPDMLQLVPLFPSYRFVIAMAPDFDEAYFTRFTSGSAVEFHRGNPYELLVMSAAALVTSGTATLETALLNIPEVVLYRTSRLSYEIARRLIKIPFISLVNLIMDREVVRELIQDECNLQSIKLELEKILPGGAGRETMLKGYAELQQKVGGPGAASRAARKMVSYLEPVKAVQKANAGQSGKPGKI